MAKYRITAPDGNAYEVTAPDDATEEQVLAYAQQNYQQPASFDSVQSSTSSTEQRSAAAAAPADPNEGMSGFDKAAAGFGKSIVDTGRGLAQLGVDFVNAPATITRRIRGEDSIPDGALDRKASELKASAAEAKRMDAPLMETGAGLAGNITGYGVQMLSPATVMRGTAGARALLPTTVSGNAAAGATMAAATQPMADGDFRLENAAWGGAFGAGGAALAKGVGALAGRAKDAIPDNVRELYEAAKARGIELTPAQLSDSRFLKFAQSMLRSVPFTGAQGRHAKQVEAFNRAAAMEIGEDAAALTPEVYAGAKSRIGGEFNRLTERNNLMVDTGLAGKLQDIQREASMFGDESTQKAVGSALARLLSQAEDGVVPGRAYQSFDSQLGQLAKNGGEKGYYLGQIREVVRGAMDASIGEGDKAAWQTARGQYRDLKTLRDLVSKGDGGAISPAALMGRVTANNAGKESMASGRRGGLGELARIGQRIKEPPSSGTAERAGVAGLLGGGAMLDPVTGGLTAAGLNLLSRGMDSKLLAAYIMRENPGMTREVAAEVIRRASNPAGQTRLSGGEPVAAPLSAPVRVAP